MDVTKFSTRALRTLVKTRSMSSMAISHRVAARAELEARDVAAFASLQEPEEAPEPGDYLLVAWDAAAQA